MANGEVGRPTVMTPEVLVKLREAFLLGCTDEEACLYANISTTPLYEYQRENPEFKQQKELLKENPVLKARTSVVNALDSNPNLALQFLERKKKKEFSPRQELTGEDGEALKISFDPVFNEITRQTEGSGSQQESV